MFLLTQYATFIRISWILMYKESMIRAISDEPVNRELSFDLLDNRKRGICRHHYVLRILALNFKLRQLAFFLFCKLRSSFDFPFGILLWSHYFGKPGEMKKWWILEKDQNQEERLCHRYVHKSDLKHRQKIVRNSSQSRNSFSTSTCSEMKVGFSFQTSAVASSRRHREVTFPSTELERKRAHSLATCSSRRYCKTRVPLLETFGAEEKREVRLTFSLPLDSHNFSSITQKYGKMTRLINQSLLIFIVRDVWIRRVDS